MFVTEDYVVWPHQGMFFGKSIMIHKKQINKFPKILQKIIDIYLQMTTKLSQLYIAVKTTRRLMVDFSSTQHDVSLFSHSTTVYGSSTGMMCTAHHSCTKKTRM